MDWTKFTLAYESVHTYNENRYTLVSRRIQNGK